MIIDIDLPNAALKWDFRGLPPPTYISINPKNGHAQYGYALRAPVCVTKYARSHPLRYLAAIESAYIHMLDADVAFNGPLAKNPLHEQWRLWEPANAPCYELGTLADYVPLSSKRAKLMESGIGRNCTIFDSLLKWAVPAIRGYWGPNGEGVWLAAVRDCAESLNVFENPLSTNEVAGIARSVARWTWRNTTPTGFRDSQAAKGAKGGKASGKSRLAASENQRASARLMAAAGKSSRQIAAELKVNQSTVVRWLSR